MIVRFQSLNSTSKPKGDLFQTKKKLWEELIVQRKEKPTKPKEEVILNFIFLKRVKFVIPFHYRSSCYYILIL